MVVKLYISRTSADKEIKHRQQVLIQILTTKQIYYEIIDIADTENDKQKAFMQKSATYSGKILVEPNPIHPLPPQIFNDEKYCGDFEHFEIANENGELDEFLKLGPHEKSFTSTIHI